MKPYYEADGITIYCGDCRELVPLLTWDVLVTDPNYGIGADRRQGERAGKQHGAAVAPSRDYGPVTDWDATAADPAFLRSLVGRPSIIWGGNYFGLPAASKWAGMGQTDRRQWIC